MNTKTNAVPEREEIEHLLPWHAAGTLSRRDARRVDEALARDPELARRFALVREEFNEDILLNETLGAPSARALEKLMAGIEAESGPAKPVPTRVSFFTWVIETVSSFSPRTLGYAAAAATLAIVLQFGALTGVMVNTVLAPDSYDTASYRSGVPGGAAGSYALIGFLPNAGVNEMTAFLEKHDLAVVDGPRAGGLYRVRVSPKALPPAELEQRVQTLRQEGALIRFIAPAQ